MCGREGSWTEGSPVERFLRCRSGIMAPGKEDGKEKEIAVVSVSKSLYPSNDLLS